MNGEEAARPYDIGEVWRTDALLDDLAAQRAGHDRPDAVSDPAVRLLATLAADVDDTGADETLPSPPAHPVPASRSTPVIGRLRRLNLAVGASVVLATVASAGVAAASTGALLAARGELAARHPIVLGTPDAGTTTSGSPSLPGAAPTGHAGAVAHGASGKTTDGSAPVSSPPAGGGPGSLVPGQSGAPVTDPPDSPSVSPSPTPPSPGALPPLSPTPPTPSGDAPGRSSDPSESSGKQPSHSPGTDPSSSDPTPGSSGKGSRNPAAPTPGTSGSRTAPPATPRQAPSPTPTLTDTAIED